ncbi:MAG: FUSC family protein [Alphaproteobacteria bacterium]
MRQAELAGRPAQEGPIDGSRPRALHALKAAGPPLLFGLRLWASVCLALYVAFRLELDEAFWAGTTAAIVCQPHLGASLRKGWFRLIGTIVGAVAIVVLTACFPQDRAAFLTGLALWGAACALAATVLRNFAAYAPALAGLTAAIIAGNQLGATGGPNGDAFMLAFARVSEISIGIVCAGVVLAGTDLGGAPRRVASLMASVSAEIAAWFIETLATAGAEFDRGQTTRRELVRQVVALDPVIDEAFGESSRLRYHSPVLQNAVDGLFAALACWRTVSLLLAHSPEKQARREADTVLRQVPPELRESAGDRAATHWIAQPTRLRRACDRAVRELAALPASTPSLRLLADQTAEVLAGVSRALNGLALLVGEPASSIRARGIRRPRVPDWLPALVNAGRAFAVIGAAELFWIVTAWPSGALAIVFAALGVILFAPQADQAYTNAVSFLIGCVLIAIIAAAVKFAILPNMQTFVGFSLAIGLVLVPAGAGVAQPWHTAAFMAMAANLVPLLAPTNQMSYDPQQFYNGALAIVGGLGAAALSFRLMPPLSPAFRTRRLLALSLRDLRRLATSPIPRTPDAWERRLYGRLSVLPDAATPLQRSQLVAAMSVGTKIIQLRRICHRFGLTPGLDEALGAFADGNGALAGARLADLDQLLAARPNGALRARSLILAISRTLTQHAAYFDAGAPR